MIPVIEDQLREGQTGFCHLVQTGVECNNGRSAKALGTHTETGLATKRTFPRTVSGETRPE